MKRCVDYLFVILSVPVLLVPLLLLALAIRVGIGSPVLFWQTRAGQAGNLFTLVKFRTMTDERGSDGELLPDAFRLNKLGRWLRATSLDELPELWNILSGDMSFVGPRPLLPEYLPLYSPTQARRHEVLPGLTGWAQVNGRNAISWAEKFALDVWYVDNRSLWLDLKILWLTFRKVFAREGVNFSGEVTMPKFMGNPPA